jgi:hypothetical protein
LGGYDVYHGHDRADPGCLVHGRQQWQPELHCDELFDCHNGTYRRRIVYGFGGQRRE